MIELRPAFEEALRNLGNWRNKYPHQVYPHKIVLNMMYRAYSTRLVYQAFANDEMPEFDDFQEAAKYVIEFYGETALREVMPYLEEWMANNPNEQVGSLCTARFEKLATQAETDKKYQEEHPDAVEPVYIIGSEVPIPGGQQGGAAGDHVEVTKPEDFRATLATFEKAFKDHGLDHAWDNVIGIVVQPGVEEKDAGCTEYDRSKAVDLMAAIKAYNNVVFEGHSTDYQTKIKLREMVEDGVGILKVGPALTYAMREALFALSFAEDELYDEGVFSSNTVINDHHYTHTWTKPDQNRVIRYALFEIKIFSTAVASGGGYCALFLDSITVTWNC